MFCIVNNYACSPGWKFILSLHSLDFMRSVSLASSGIALRYDVPYRLLLLTDHA